MSRERDHDETTRRGFALGVGALFLSACRIMSQVRTTDVLLTSPSADEWRPVLLGLIDAVLPFAHPSFPQVTQAEVLAQLLRLFPIEDDESLATLPQALLLFDDCALFDSPPAPFVDDERRDLARSRVPAAEIDAHLARKLTQDENSWRAQRAKFGGRRFTALGTEERRGYLDLWAASELITRRRFYRGVRALVTIGAYSMVPFWLAVGYEGPVLRPG